MTFWAFVMTLLVGFFIGTWTVVLLASYLEYKSEEMQKDIDAKVAEMREPLEFDPTTQQIR